LDNIYLILNEIDTGANVGIWKPKLKIDWDFELELNSKQSDAF